MTPLEVLSQIELRENKIYSKSTGNLYEINDFIDNLSKKLKWSKAERKELESYLTSYLRPQSDKSKHIENIIDKYKFEFSDGIYFINNELISLPDIYRLFWKKEKLLPTETDEIIENIEKISEPKELQNEIFTKISDKAIKGTSKYLASLDTLYKNIDFRSIFYNILVPQSKPLFHIFYDDGVGGTGKSTLLEVITKIVGETYTSNVLLDQFSNRFVFANMLGKYINVGDDNGRNDELANVGTLKSIITGNRITIDRKNISPIEVRIFAKQLFATNILPYIDFTDGGIMRRLNIVKMNKVIPDNMKLCELNEEEIGHIVYEVLHYHDITENYNELAITESPLYMFYMTAEKPEYESYKSFCYDNGFRQMNIINFKVKSKFIKSYIDKKKNKKQKTIRLVEDKDDEFNPF